MLGNTAWRKQNTADFVDFAVGSRDRATDGRVAVQQHMLLALTPDVLVIVVALAILPCTNANLLLFTVQAFELEFGVEQLAVLQILLCLLVGQQVIRKNFVDDFVRWHWVVVFSVVVFVVFVFAVVKGNRRLIGRRGLGRRATSTVTVVWVVRVTMLAAVVQAANCVVVGSKEGNGADEKKGK